MSSTFASNRSSRRAQTDVCKEKAMLSVVCGENIGQVNATVVVRVGNSSDYLNRGLDARRHATESFGLRRYRVMEHKQIVRMKST